MYFTSISPSLTHLPFLAYSLIQYCVKAPHILHKLKEKLIPYKNFICKKIKIKKMEF